LVCGWWISFYSPDKAASDEGHLVESFRVIAGQTRGSFEIDGFLVQMPHLAGLGAVCNRVGMNHFREQLNGLHRFPKLDHEMAKGRWRRY